jgi:GTP-binding protein HflX
VASFKATLEEAVHADLLLHVLDVGHPHAEQQFQAVHDVLKDIGAAGKPEILLLNKIDTEAGEAAMDTWRTLYPQAIPISAKTGRGIDRLTEAVFDHLRGQQVEATLEADVANGRLLSFIESHTRVQDRHFLDGRVTMRVVVGKKVLADLARNGQVEIKDVSGEARQTA